MLELDYYEIRNITKKALYVDFNNKNFMKSMKKQDPPQTISRIQINFECGYQEIAHEGNAHVLYGLIKVLDIIQLSCP